MKINIKQGEGKETLVHPNRDILEYTTVLEHVTISRSFVLGNMNIHENSQKSFPVVEFFFPFVRQNTRFIQIHPLIRLNPIHSAEFTVQRMFQ